MPSTQLARGLWTGFANTENPFQVPNGMPENLRVIDDLIGLFTLVPPVQPGTPLPSAAADGDGQIFTDGSFSVFNGGAWKTYAPRAGVHAMLADGLDAYLSTAAGGWVRWSSVGKLPSYAALRAYTGSIDRVLIQAPGIEGSFFVDADDHASPDDGGVTIVGADGRRWKRQYSGAVSGEWFETVGDGIADDWMPLSRFFNYLNSSNERGELPPKRFKTTRQLPILFSRGGLDMHSVAADTTGAGCIVVAGTGYTAMVVMGSPSTLNLSLCGTGNECDGLILQSVILAETGSIRVSKLAGAGVQVNRMWDCVVGPISVEECGTSAKWALSVNDSGDTSNSTNFKRLQVEKPQGLGIYISPNTLNCVFDAIHSEGLSPNNALVAWSLGGNRCNYRCVRLQAYNSQDAHVVLSGANTTYSNLVVEGSASVNVEGYGGSTVTLVDPEIQGSLAEVQNQTGIVNVLGGRIKTLTGQTSNLIFTGTRIGDVLVWSKKKTYTYTNGNARTEASTKTVNDQSNEVFLTGVAGGLLWVRDVTSGVSALLRTGAGGSSIVQGDSAWTVGSSPAALGVSQAGSSIRIYNNTGSPRTVDALYLGV
ncbi:hypothetical protein [Paracidovorax wautersii]|uniref:hypothetical protein n=1 Tax=Paracidovorax wautersii TaxID=1177982 RepID=UPI0031D956ED